VSLISVRQLTKQYELDGVIVPVLRGIDLDIEPGEFVAIVGQSGSGKSTLMHILGLLDTPTSGEYLLDGQPVADLTEDERAVRRTNKIGFIFQAFNLLARTTSLENVTLPTLYSRLSPRTAKERARELLTRVGLADRLEHMPNQLSGGQQQRVAIARSLVNDPSIVFADEPTGNLDTRSGHEVMALLDGLAKEGKTVILVTHSQEVAEHAHRLITIRDGEIVGDKKR
jgi:putative ABC transport system ATP-binding protein